MGFEIKKNRGNEIVTPIVNDTEAQFKGDPEITAEITQAKEQEKTFNGIEEAKVLEIMNNPEEKKKFLEHLKALESKLKAIEKYWPAIATALVAIAALIAAFAMDADVESSKIQISHGLAAISVVFGFFSAFNYLNKSEKEGKSGTPQHA